MLNPGKRLSRLSASFLITIAGLSGLVKSNETMMIFDFTSMANVDNWMEISDTVRTVGKSKATLVLQRTQEFQRGVFFTLLNPQPNGAGFAGVRTPVALNLTNYDNLVVTCRGQGQNQHYKAVLRHKGQQSDSDISYEQLFDVSTVEKDFKKILLPLSNFKPYYRGREQPTADPLDKSDITMFGLQVFGGVYFPFKQSGVSALEIEKIEAFLIGGMVASSTPGNVQTLFDFTKSDEIENWLECSDTSKANGMSKAVIIIQKTANFQRAIFFTLFNPTANGSGYAAIRSNANCDLSGNNYILIKCRGQGVNLKYKMLLRHQGLFENSPVYGQIFTAPETDFGIVKLSLRDFKPYLRGKELALENHPLDLTSITNIGLKIDKSSYLAETQAGVAALEIDWIKAAK